MRCRTPRMARGRSANLVIPLCLDAIACVTAVTLRPTASHRGVTTAEEHLCSFPHHAHTLMGMPVEGAERHPRGGLALLS